MDRDYVERETTLTINKQLKCEEKLVAMGVVVKDPENPNRLTISVSNMVEIITDEDTKKLKKATKAAKEEAKIAKVEGIKETMKKCLTESDPELRAALERWVEGMVDAANCRFTKAVIQLFEKTLSEYTSDKAIKLKAIEIATIHSYKDASWAFNKLSVARGNKQFTATNIPAQKVCAGVSDTVSF